MKDSFKNFYRKYLPDKQAFMNVETKQRLKHQNIKNLTASYAISVVPSSFWSNILLKSYFTVPILLILFVAGTAYASTNSLPGDFLYPVKTKVEDARLFISPTLQSKSELKIEFAKKRLEELTKLNQNRNNNSNVNHSEDEEGLSNKNARESFFSDDDHQELENNITKNAEDALKDFRDTQEQIEKRIIVKPRS